jgi:tryptophanyl-tRNA synthetase
MTKRLLSGIQPTGELHIGNYLGAIKQWLEYQDDYEAFFMIADYHTLTLRLAPEKLRQQTYDLIAMLVALGIDPKSSALFLQSQLPAHTELAWIFSSFAMVGQLNRMTQYKEKSDHHGQNAGLLTYPVLQTADIELYKANIVPIGEDQVQHLELSREIIRSFNHHVGQAVFPEPKTMLNKGARIMALNNPTRKMSKSVAGGAIGLLDSEATITQTIKRAVTDSDINSSEVSDGVKNLLLLLEGVSSHETVQHFDQLRSEGKLRYSDLKEALIEDLMHFLSPIQQAYHGLRRDEKNLLQIVETGRQKAEVVANETLDEAKKALGLIVN